MGSNSADFSAQTARGAAFRRDTHISAPHARCAASSPTKPHKGMRSASQCTPLSQEVLQGSNTLSPQWLPEPAIHSERRCRHISTGCLVTVAARLEPSGAADRSMLMNSPSTTAQTAIGVVGEDVVGSLQHAPLMDTIRAPTSTSLLNFRTTRSASQPPGRMPK